MLKKFIKFQNKCFIIFGLELKLVVTIFYLQKKNEKGISKIADNIDSKF